MRNYKIENEEWEIVDIKKSRSFISLEYRRDHENYDNSQRKKEIYKKEGDLKLVAKLKEGVLGGMWTGIFEQRTHKFKDLELYDGNKKKRTGVNTGTKGKVEGLTLSEHDDKIFIDNQYCTGKWSRRRVWTIEIKEE